MKLWRTERNSPDDTVGVIGQPYGRLLLKAGQRELASIHDYIHDFRDLTARFDANQGGHI
jgi:hypothetical protein